jgi:hypothetical protein
MSVAECFWKSTEIDHIMVTNPAVGLYANLKSLFHDNG